MDIIKSAADAVGKSKLKPSNTLNTALTLLFNFILEREVWPGRWGSGIIFPQREGSPPTSTPVRPATLYGARTHMSGSTTRVYVASYGDNCKQCTT
jgi:hypothetical protein